MLCKTEPTEEKMNKIVKESMRTIQSERHKSVKKVEDIETETLDQKKKELPPLNKKAEYAEVNKLVKKKRRRVKRRKRKEIIQET